MNARMHATSPLGDAGPGPCRPGPLHARLPRVRRPPRQRLAEHRRRRRRLYLRHRRQPLPRRGGRHVVHQHRPGARGNGSHRGRADPPAGLFQSLLRHGQPARHRTLPQARRAGPRRPRPRVPHHRRFHRRGHRDPPHALLPELPRQARQEARHHADQRLPRLDLPRHVAGRQERRPAGRVRLPRRAHPPPCLSLLLPRSGRSGRGRVPRWPGGGVRTQDPRTGRRPGGGVHLRAGVRLRRRDRPRPRATTGGCGICASATTCCTFPTKW